MNRCPVLVERDDELRALQELAAGSVAVITGEAGTGKSRLAQEFAATRPYARVVDDAQTLDPAAIDALPARLDADAVIVVTFRLGVHPAGSAEMRALARLVRDPRVVELRLLPLSPDGIERMAAAMGRYATADLHARTGGNPFWAEEILRTGIRLPWTVLETVTVQLDALPPTARDLACALAVAEVPLPASAVPALVDDVDAAWAALAATGLAVREGDGLRLRHALVSEALLARVGPAERVAWHERLAGALADTAEPDRLARHWAEAGETERAAALARSAAAGLRAGGATRRAFACYELALRTEADAALFEDAALTAAAIGEYDAMREWVASAERLYREAGQADRAARMLLDPALDYLPVRRSAAIRDEPVERLLVDAQVAMAAADPATARDLVGAAIEAARSRRDGMALARSARMLLFSFGEFERGEALLDEALTYPGTAGQPARESRVLTIRAVARIARGYPLEAIDMLRRVVAVGRQEPDAVRWPGQIALGDALLLTGRFDEGAALIADAMAWGEAMEVAVGAITRFERVDAAGALPDLERGTDDLLTEYDFDPLGRAVTAAHILHPRALAEIHADRPDAALLTLARLDALAPEPFNDVAADLAYVRARAGASLGDTDMLADARRRIGDIARVASGPGVMAVVAAVRGFATGEAAHFRAAAALFEQAPRPVLAAELWCDAARAAGTASAAATALDRAERLCLEYGLARVRARAAALRGEPVPDALAELTPRERAVVLLAAEGLSNREIGARLYLAEGTVRNYLSTAFAKLGVTRRGELGRLVATLQPTA